MFFHIVLTEMSKHYTITHKSVRNRNFFQVHLEPLPSRRVMVLKLKPWLFLLQSSITHPPSLRHATSLVESMLRVAP